jgi:hypothetical protein
MSRSGAVVQGDVVAVWVGEGEGSTEGAVDRCGDDGSTWCVHTSQGRYGSLKVSHSFLSLGLKLSYTLWKHPGDR